nr:hypothetical protein [Bacillus subtilis]
MSMNEHMDHLYTKRKQAEEGGGREKAGSAAAKRASSLLGKGIIFLLDQDSFIELHPFMESQVLTREQRMLGDGVVTGKFWHNSTAAQFMFLRKTSQCLEGRLAKPMPGKSAL